MLFFRSSDITLPEEKSKSKVYELYKEGKEEVMKYANSSFISSTFWTERIGPTAALKTL